MNSFWAGFEKRAAPNYNQEDLASHKGIAAVIRNEHGHVLVQKHNKFGFWTIPVGKVKPDETVRQGLHTELFEETGIKPIRPKLIGRETKTYRREGKPVAVDLHLFEIPKYHGTPANLEPHKHSEQRFMSLEELRSKKNVSDATKLFLRGLDKTAAPKWLKVLRKNPAKFLGDIGLTTSHSGHASLMKNEIAQALVGPAKEQRKNIGTVLGFRPHQAIHDSLPISHPERRKYYLRDLKNNVIKVLPDHWDLNIPGFSEYGFSRERALEATKEYFKNELWPMIGKKSPNAKGILPYKYLNSKDTVDVISGVSNPSKLKTSINAKSPSALLQNYSTNSIFAFPDHYEHSPVMSKDIGGTVLRSRVPQRDVIYQANTFRPKDSTPEIVVPGHLFIQGLKKESSWAKQSIIVSKEHAPDRSTAKEIAKGFADRLYTSRETGTSYRFRQKPPSAFDQSTFRTKQVKPGVSIVYGKLVETSAD